MENRYAVDVESLVGSARVGPEAQVEAQATGGHPEPVWRGPVPPWGDGAGGGGPLGDGDGD